MVEIPLREAEQGPVMPANAGIQVDFRCNFKCLLDSGFRRKDGNKRRLPVDEFRIPRPSGRGSFKPTSEREGV